MVSKSDGFSVSQFYGKNRKQREAIIRKKLGQAQRRLPLDFHHRILGPTYCWKIFYRQNEAFRWAEQQAKDLQVFAFESCDGDHSTLPGRRRYLVTSLDVFWHYYSQLEPSQRHHYEIIPEGCPCQLYFDLEFLKEFNPGSDGDKMVEMLIKYVCTWLEAEFSLHCGRTDILDLDASTQNKFSRHLIFHLPGALFENCVSTGNFVRHIFGALLKFINLGSKTWDCDPYKNQGLASGQLLSEGNFDFDEDEDELLAVVQTYDEACSSEKSGISSVAKRTIVGCCVMAHGTSGNDCPLNMRTSCDICTVARTTKAAHAVRKGTNEDVPTDNWLGWGTNPFYSVIVKGETCCNICSVTEGTNGDMYTETVTERTNGLMCHETVTERTNGLMCHETVTERTNGLMCHETVTERTNGDMCPEAVTERTNGDMCPEAVTDESSIDTFAVENKIKRICSQFSLDDLKSLLVFNKDGERTLFCDLGVYTRNRNFRLYLSSKLNKNNPLLVSSWNQFKPVRTADKISDKQAMFNDSLVSYRSLSPGLRVLRFGKQESSQCHLERSTSTGACDSPGSCLTKNEDSLEGLGCSSPYPEIDEHIESVTSSHGCHGRVRHWTYFRSCETILYDIIGCRWCGRVGREHRSNNIMYVADLRSGIFYQKCYDPDCQAARYRSCAKEIPKHLLPLSFFDDDDNNEVDDGWDDVDDSLLLTAIKNAEMEYVPQDFQQNGDFSYGGGAEDDDALVAVTKEVEMHFQ